MIVNYKISVYKTIVKLRYKTKEVKNMELEIYEGEEESKKKIRLELFREGKDIQLRVVDFGGNRLSAGHLLTIQSTGKILLCRNVNRKLGFELDEKGIIELDE